MTTGFALKFHFAPNPFFTNDLLKKEYLLGVTGKLYVPSETTVV